MSSPDLSAETRWPLFVPQALNAGYAGVYAVPMRLHENTIGGVNLFTVSRGELDPDIVAGAQALTDVAAIALLHQRAMQQRELVVAQLQRVLNDRLAIEQAKGMVAEQADVSVGTAFELIRAYAQRYRQTITDIAKRIVERDPAVADVVPPAE